MSERNGDCPLVGTWTLTGWEILVEGDPTTAPPEWERARGQLMYSAEGRMAMQMSNADREPFAGSKFYSATTDEKLRAWDGYRAYTGTFRWEGDRVVHVVDQSNYPNMIGTEQVRLVTLEGSQLILTNENRSIAMIWERAATA